MGSQLVRALIQQIARVKTNPDDVTDEDGNDVSRPIFQGFTKIISSQAIMEQVSLSSPVIGQISPSRPIEQVELETPITPEYDGLLEQVALRTNQAGDLTIIEQRRFDTSIFSGGLGGITSNLVEQRNLITAPNTSKPIEQVAQISNTINIEQFDFIDLIFPICGSIRNPVDTDILVRLRNFGFAFNLDTLVFKVDGLEVQNSPSFVITPLVNGVQLDYDPPIEFEYGSQVDVFIQIRDTASIPRTFIFRCSFFTTPDTLGPRVQNFILCNQVNVDSRAAVEFDIVDLESGVNRDSIRLSIEGIEVCEGLSIDPLTVSGSNGFHVLWEHNNSPFRYGSKVTAAVEADDNADPPNGSLFVCRFQVEQSNPPEFTNIHPEPCDSFVDNTTGLSFEVYGVEHGVDISTLEVKVDSRTRKVYVRPRIRRVE